MIYGSSSTTRLFERPSIFYWKDNHNVYCHFWFGSGTRDLSTSVFVISFLWRICTKIHNLYSSHTMCNLGFDRVRGWCPNSQRDTQTNFPFLFLVRHNGTHLRPSLVGKKYCLCVCTHFFRIELTKQNWGYKPYTALKSWARYQFHVNPKCTYLLALYTCWKQCMQQCC